MTGGHDPDNRRAFPWDPARWEPGLRDTFRTLLHLRAAEPALRHGSLRFVAADGPAAAFERHADADRLIVVANPGEAPARLELELNGDGGEPLECLPRADRRPRPGPDRARSGGRLVERRSTFGRGPVAILRAK